MTRSNIYICDDIVGEVPSDSYPGGDLWNTLCDLDEKQVTEKEFRKAVLKFIPKTGGYRKRIVGNWSYEFVFIPVNPPVSPGGRVYYQDWKSWTGIIMYREIDSRMWKNEFKDAYWQLPGTWKRITRKG